MKKVVLILTMLVASIGFSQSEKEIVSEFKQAYNASNYEGIYNLFSANKQAEMSLESTTSYFKRLRSSFGTLSNITFVKNEKTSRHIFKAIFSELEAEVLVTLNAKGKAEELDIRQTEK